MKNFKILIILGVIVFVAFGIIQYVSQEPKASQVEEELNVELSRITHPPQATLVKHDSSHKVGQALVGDKYFTSINFIDICDYYNDLLPKLGWQLENQKETRDWGKNLGGKILYYRKGNYDLSLEYSGDQANYEWSYAIDLSWGLN